MNVIVPSPIPNLANDYSLPPPTFLTVGAGNHLIYLLRQDRAGTAIVQLVAAQSGEGTSSLARDLCLIAAQFTPLRILLVEIGAPGYQQVDWFRENLMPIEMQARPIEGLPPGIAVHTAGNGALCVSENCLKGALGAVDWMRALPILRTQFDLLVLDSPALATSFDAVMLAPHVDHTVLVVAAETTRAAVAQNLRDRIQDVGGNIAGTILNRRQFHIPRALYRFV